MQCTPNVTRVPLLTHCMQKPYYLGQAKLLDFFVGFLQDIAKDLSSIKISVNHRARTVARNYLKSFK